MANDGLDDLSLPEKLFAAPRTSPGRRAVAFAVVFAALALLTFLWESRAANPVPGFAVDPPAAALLLAALASAVSAAVYSGVAIFGRRERSLLLFLVLALGLIVLLYAAGEILEGVGRRS